MIPIKIKKISNELIWITIGQIVSIIGSFLGIRLLTKYLTPIEYGNLALGMTVSTLVNQVVFGPLSNGITRFYAPAIESKQLGVFFASSKKLIFFATKITLIIFPIGLITLLLINKSQLILILFVSIFFSIFSGFNGILSGIQNAARQRIIVALHQGVDSWFKFIFGILLIFLLGSTSSATMIGYSIGAVFIFISQYYFFIKIYNFNNESASVDYKKKIWNFSWPFSIFGIFTFFQLISDRWSLQFFTTSYEVGLYAVLYQLGYYPIVLANTVIGQLLLPILYEKSGDSSDGARNVVVKKIIRNVSLVSFSLTLFAFIVAYFFHNLIFDFFVDPKFKKISYLLPLTVLAAGFFSTSQILLTNLMVELKSKMLMKSKIITSIIGVILNIFGAYKFGIKGIVFASVLYSIIYLLWSTKLLYDSYK